MSSWSLWDCDRRHLCFALAKTRGKLLPAAVLLGIDDKSLRNKVKRFGLEKYLEVLRFAEKIRKLSDRSILDRYERKTMEQEEAVSRALTQIATMDLDILLAEVLQWKALYEADIEGEEEDKFLKRKAFKTSYDAGLPKRGVEE